MLEIWRRLKKKCNTSKLFVMLMEGTFVTRRWSICMPKVSVVDAYSLGTAVVEPVQEDSSRTDNHATSAAETVQDFSSWRRYGIEGEEVIRSSTNGGDEDENDDSDSDHSDNLSDCERDDLV
ncbi:hypothetical protein MKW94_017254 [Papaver nudicaule]|uniref:Uncharacterized protein n=1 Tax=Papaver nudicaule TaxID=74823 RepID=A0AA41VA19_PAPNU|nr:hypothetical protein [Papaver nudicaule]